MLRGDGVAVIKQRDAGVVDPGAKDGVERKAVAAQVLLEIFRLERLRALIGDFVSLVADVEFGNVALLGEFEAFLIGEFGETPKVGAIAGGAAVVEAKDFSLEFAVVDGEIGIASERLNRLIEESLGLAGILLVKRDRSSGGLRG